MTVGSPLSADLGSLTSALCPYLPARVQPLGCRRNALRHPSSAPTPLPSGITQGAGSTPCFAEQEGDFLRYSPGLLARWLSPFGALGVSIARPLNTVRGDRTQLFQFSFGQAF